MDLLEKLCVTPGVPGREHRVRDLILKESKKLWDETYVDAMGSLICHRKPRPGKGAKKKTKPTKVMLASHMDQIGFLVRHIDDKGFLRVNAVGGFDTRNLFARLVTVCTKGGDLTGVMNPGGKPVHIASAEDRKKVPDVEELIVDLGMSGDDVKKKVQIGDMVVIQAPFREIGNTIVSQCLDNRIACWETIRAVEKLKNHSCDIWAVFTVQEEVGCRGAGPAAEQIQPDVAITLDTTLCCDTPGVPSDMAVTEQGKGAGLMVMDSSAIVDVDLLNEFEALAKKKKIPAQRTILHRGGTDSSAIQRKGPGYRVMTLVCGTRYIHTVTEMIHKDDLFACRDLLAAWLEQA